MLIRNLLIAVMAVASLSLSHLATAQETAAKSAKGKDIITTAVEAGSFNTLAAALKAGDLIEALQGEGPFTVFAPTDEAFAKLPAETIEMLLKKENKALLVSILTYHVVSGNVDAAQVVELNAAATLNGQRVDIKAEDGSVMIDKSNVVKADIMCSNGVIHVIDTVLMPSTDNIPATADKAGSFKTLLAAAKAAGLVEALSSGEPLTVFAPTDEAFAALPKGTVESLLKPENKDKLAAILKFHVVAGRVYSPEVLNKGKLTSLEGNLLTASVKDDVASINGAKILATDIDASNGVIHVIGSVMLPPAKTETEGKGHEMPTAYRTHVCPVTGQVSYIAVTPATCGK
jgi:uncharacterized surface protein with fasciclin (FAS1) repeats